MYIWCFNERREVVSCVATLVELSILLLLLKDIFATFKILKLTDPHPLPSNLNLFKDIVSCLLTSIMSVEKSVVNYIVVSEKVKLFFLIVFKIFHFCF